LRAWLSLYMDLTGGSHFCPTGSRQCRCRLQQYNHQYQDYQQYTQRATNYIYTRHVIRPASSNLASIARIKQVVAQLMGCLWRCFLLSKVYRAINRQGIAEYQGTVNRQLRSRAGWCCRDAKRQDYGWQHDRSSWASDQQCLYKRLFANRPAASQCAKVCAAT
jgi:hypothetical protein